MGKAESRDEKSGVERDQSGRRETFTGTLSRRSFTLSVFQIQVCC
jgi:hypothetical protein